MVYSVYKLSRRDVTRLSITQAQRAKNKEVTFNIWNCSNKYKYYITC